jgi:hypothetical protein
MSTDAYQRNQNRETSLWNPFTYSCPFSSLQTDARTTVFGLYSNSYVNGQGYLIEIEAQELANVLADYNEKIARLSYEEQTILADIVTKRYLANIDKLIHDNKMVTYNLKIAAEEAEWDAKVAALSADQAALTTLAAKVASETDKTNARIQELQAMTQIESYNQSAMDIEIAEKELELSKEDLKILDAANGLLKIQINTVNAAMELVELDLRALNMGIQANEMDRSIAKTALLEKRLKVEQAKTDLAEAESDIIEAQAAIAEKRTAIALKELDSYEERVDHAQDTLANKLVLMDAEQTRKLTAISDREDNALFDVSVKKDAANFNYTSAANDQDTQEAIDADRVGVIGYQAWSARTLDQAAINAAITAAQTEIATQLTHLIQRASGE